MRLLSASLEPQNCIINSLVPNAIQTEYENSNLYTRKVESLRSVDILRQLV